MSPLGLCRHPPETKRSVSGPCAGSGESVREALEGRVWQGELDVLPSAKHIPHLPPEAREQREQTGFRGWVLGAVQAAGLKEMWLHRKAVEN